MESAPDTHILSASRFMIYFCSLVIRNEVKNPVILFSIRSLCQTFEEWVPNLHKALKSCHELKASINGSDTAIALTTFLDASAFDDISYLTQMCFDCGVYGREGLDALDDAQNQTETANVVDQDKEQNINDGDSKDSNLGELTSIGSQAILQTETGAFAPAVSLESTEGVAGSSQVDFFLVNTNALAIDSDLSASCLTRKEIEEGKTNEVSSDEGSQERTPTVTVTDVSVDITEPMKDLLSEVNATTQNSIDNISFPEEISEDNLLAQETTSSLKSAQSSDRICSQCENNTAFCKSNSSMELGNNGESCTRQTNDMIRSRFLSYYFFLLDVKRLRRTLLMSKGERQKTWNTLIHCLSSKECFQISYFQFAKRCKYS